MRAARRIVLSQIISFVRSFMSKLPLVRQKVSVLRKVKELVENVGNWRQKASNGELRSTTTIRSIFWKIYLGILSEGSMDSWIDEITRERREYDKFLEKWYRFDPKDMDEEDLSVNNPLSVSTENVWGEFFKSKELKKKISIDLDRLFPEYRFFQDPKTHETLLKILFIWSKKNPGYSYKQGFHDILGVLYLVCIRDGQHLEEEIPNDLKDYEKIVRVVCDPKYVEHDSFLMLNKILIKVRKYYGRKESEDDSGIPRRRRARGQQMKQAPIFVIGERIQNDLLKTIDPPLYDHLELLGIQPQVYLLKWVRLLFLRVFHLDDVIILWDAFLSHHKEFIDNTDNLPATLIEHICLNMIMCIRTKLLSNSVVKCLELLMNKYPQVEDTYIFFRNAKMTMANPKKVLHRRKLKKKKKANTHMTKREILNEGGVSAATKRVIRGERVSEKLAKKFNVNRPPLSSKLSGFTAKAESKDSNFSSSNPSIQTRDVKKSNQTKKSSNNQKSGGFAQTFRNAFQPFKDKLGGRSGGLSSSSNIVISNPKVHHRTFVRKSDVDKMRGSGDTKRIQNSVKKHPLNQSSKLPPPPKSNTTKRKSNKFSPKLPSMLKRKKKSSWSVVDTSSSSNKFSANFSNVKNKEMMQRQYDLGQLMDELLYLVQQEVELGKKNMDMDVILLSVAQLKHIKDVLIGAIDFDGPTLGRLRKQNQEFRKMIEEKKVLKRIQEQKEEVEKSFKNMQAAIDTNPSLSEFEDSLSSNKNTEGGGGGGELASSNNYDPFQQQNQEDDEDTEKSENDLLSDDEVTPSRGQDEYLEDHHAVVDDYTTEFDDDIDDSLRYVEDQEDDYVNEQEKAKIMDEIGITPSNNSFSTPNQVEGFDEMTPADFFSGGLSSSSSSEAKPRKESGKKKMEIRDKNLFGDDEDGDDDPLMSMLTMDGDFDGENNLNDSTNDIDAIFGDL